MPRTIFFLLLAVAWLPGCGVRRAPASAAIDSRKYYAVMLTSGSVYFGRLEGVGSPFPVLHDVFYIQQGPVDPGTKQSQGMVLVHRGKELHGPDRMILNEKSIEFIEPVGDGSRVAELIREAQNLK